MKQNIIIKNLLFFFVNLIFLFSYVALQIQIYNKVMIKEFHLFSIHLIWGKSDSQCHYKRLQDSRNLYGVCMINKCYFFLVYGIVF